MDLPAAALVLTASVWVTLPHGDTAQDLLETVVPFTFADAINTGGAVTGKPSIVGSEGMSWGATTYELGVQDITNPSRGGTALVYPDLSAFEELRISSTGAPVEQSSPGPSIGLVARRASTTWRSDVSLGGSPSLLQAGGPSAPPPISRLDWLARLDGSAGGALGSAGPRLFVAAALTRSRHFERNTPAQLPGDVTSVVAHIGAREGVADDWTLSGWAQQITRPYESRALFAVTDVREHDRYLGVSGGWQRAAAVPIRIDGGVQTMRISTGATAIPYGTIERLRDGPVQELVAYAPGTASRAGVAALVSLEPKGRHTARFGASASYGAIRSTPAGTGIIGEMVDGLAARAWNYGYGGTDDRHEFSVTLHGADRIALGDGLTIDLGARLERVSASNGTASIAWTSAAPAVAINYSPGEWVFTASARRYHQPLTLNLLAFGDVAAPAGAVYRWTDANGDGIVQQNELGPVVALAGPGAGSSGLSSIDPALKRPHTDEAVLAVERRFGDHWAVRFSGVTRRKRDIIGAVNTGVPFDAYTVSYVFDPGLDLLGTEDDQMLPIFSRPAATFAKDRYLLTNIPSVTGTYSTLYLSVSTRGYERWTLLAGASALRTRAPAAYRGFGPLENDDNLVGDAFSDPNSNTYSMGRLLFDRGYAAKLTASYRAGHGITLGTVARYEDGQPFARLVLAPDLPQGADVVRAYANGRSRFTYLLTLDARVAKEFTIGGSGFTVSLDAFNLLDSKNEVEEDTVWGTSWRAPTAVQPPRVLRIGLRLQF